MFDMNEINEIIWKETQQASYEEQSEQSLYQHQESPNEDYFECRNEYLDGIWCN